MQFFDAGSLALRGSAPAGALPDMLTFTPDGASALDANDRDGIRIVPQANVFGMYQPDAIAAYTLKDKTFLVTADEGDARDYDAFGEEKRASALPLDEDVFGRTRRGGRSRAAGRRRWRWRGG